MNAARTCARRQTRRGYATAAAPTLVGTPSVRRPVGGLRGGLAGFALGFAAASAYCSGYLLRDYKAASHRILTSVEDMQASTQQITSHLTRISKLEAELKALKESSSTKVDAGRARTDLIKVYDGLQEEVLQLKTRLWTIEREVNRGQRSLPDADAAGPPVRLV